MGLYTPDWDWEIVYIYVEFLAGNYICLKNNCVTFAFDHVTILV